MKGKLKYAQDNKTGRGIFKQTFPERNSRNFSSWDKGTPGSHLGRSEGHQDRPWYRKS